jgi:DNA-binding transcriptional MerR regulator
VACWLSTLTYQQLTSAQQHRAAVSELGLSLAELHSQLEKARAAGAEATQGGSDVKAAQLQHDLDAAREQQERTEQSRQYLEAALAAKKAEHEQLRVLAVSRLDEVHELTASSRKLQVRSPPYQLAHHRASASLAP